MFERFFVLFAMVGVGYYANRKNIITSAINTGIGSLVMKLTCPALLFVTIVSNEIDSKRLKVFFMLAAAQYAASLIGGKVMRAYSRARGWQDKYFAMLEVTTATTNNGFIGLPIAMMFFGQAGAFYMSPGFLGIHLYVWTYAVRVLQGEKGKNASLKETLEKLLNPNCVMVFAGLIFSLTGLIHFVPNCILESMSTLGGMSTPLSLIYIGALAGNEGISKLIQHRDSLDISLIRSIAFPAAALALLWVLPVDPLIKTICLVSMACPCAAIMPMVVEQYGDGGKEKSSEITLLTTFFSMGIMPLCLWLAEICF